MKYPVVDDREARAYIEGRRDGSIPATTRPPYTSREAAGEELVDVFEIVEEAVDAVQDWTGPSASRSKTDKDAIEGELSIALYRGLRDLPTAILTDRGFWRFVATYWMYEFIQWRDGENCRPDSFGAQEGLGALWDCVPLRMFDRALISERVAGATELEDASWAAKIAGTDLWRSHILRVLIGNSPTVVKAMLEDVQAKLLPTSTLRPFVKHLQRTRSNVMFELLDADDARALVDEHRTKTESQKAEDVEGG